MAEGLQAAAEEEEATAAAATFGLAKPVPSAQGPTLVSSMPADCPTRRRDSCLLEWNRVQGQEEEVEEQEGWEAGG